MKKTLLLLIIFTSFCFAQKTGAPDRQAAIRVPVDAALRIRTLELASSRLSNQMGQLQARYNQLSNEANLNQKDLALELETVARALHVDLTKYRLSDATLAFEPIPASAKGKVTK